MYAIPISNKHAVAHGYFDACHHEHINTDPNKTTNGNYYKHAITDEAATNTDFHPNAR